MHKNVRSSPIQKSPKLETTQMAIDCKMDKYIVMQSHNGVPFCSDNEWTPATLNYMNTFSQKHTVE